MIVLVAIFVFLLSATVAVPWALWSKAVADLAPVRAAVADMAILAFGGLSVLIYTEQHWMLPLVILGGGCGTYCTVLRAQRKATPTSMSDADLVEELARLRAKMDEVSGVHPVSRGVPKNVGQWQEGY